MKKVVLGFLLLVLSFANYAKTINAELIDLSPAITDSVIRLVEKQSGPTLKKLSIVVADYGLSTDVSPRYGVYLGYNSINEWGNITASFKLNENVQKLLSAKRIEAGIYEIQVEEYRPEIGIVKVTQRIDATKMFEDENAARSICGFDPCDRDLKTSIELTEKIEN